MEKGARKNANSSDDACENYTDYVSYEYDNLNQLTRENSVAKNTTTLWSYDEQGNITSKSEYGLTDVEAPTNPNKTVTYNYGKDSDAGWNNLLLNVDFDDDDIVDPEEIIDYDAIGNPVRYLGANLEWFGRQLQKYTKGSTIVDYTYDADGLRTSKTVDGATTTYQYVGDKLYYLCAKDATGADDYEMYFFYDSYDKLTVLKYFKHKGENPGEYTYYVATNYFGDVVALYSGQGDLRVTYEYDAWGNIIAVRDADEAIITDSDSIAHRNPIRYRSYYYDTETGLYYLQSRYYNPEIGRFLNSDSISDPGAGVLAFNTFMYCANNPVNASDPSGHALLTTLLVGFVVGAVVSAIAEAGCQYLDDGKVSNWRKVGCSALVGGVFGAISGGASSAIANSAISATKKAVFSIVSDSVFNVIENATNSLLRGETFTAEIAAKSFVQGAVSSTLGFGASSFIKNKNITKFNKLSNNKKKILMNSYSDGTHIIRSFIRSDDFLKSDVYTKYISRGTVAGEKATSSITSLSFCFYENEH